MTIDEFKYLVKNGKSAISILIDMYGIYSGFSKNNLHVLYTDRMYEKSDVHYISESILLARIENDNMNMLYEITLCCNNILNETFDKIDTVERLIEIIFSDPSKVSHRSTSSTSNPYITNRKKLPECLDILKHYIKHHNNKEYLDYSLVDRLILWYMTLSAIKSNRLKRTQCMSITDFKNSNDSIYVLFLDSNYIINISINKNTLIVYIKKDGKAFNWRG